MLKKNEKLVVLIQLQEPELQDQTLEEHQHALGGYVLDGILHEIQLVVK